MEALSSALAAVHPQLAGHAEELYGTHLVSADTFVKVAASKQKHKLVEFGLTQKRQRDALICIPHHLQVSIKACMDPTAPSQIQECHELVL